MNPVTALLLFFCLLGLLDKIRNNRWGLAGFIDQGLSAAGSFVVPYIGICCFGPLLLNRLLEAAPAKSPFDPAILLGSLLAPDLGGFKLSLGFASDPLIGAFSAVVIAGCFGQFISFQLPMLSASIRESPHLLTEGFIIGLIAAPVGMLLGGLYLGLSAMAFVRCALPFLICALIAAGFLLRPELTQAVLQRLGLLLQRTCVVFFCIVIVLLFLQNDKVVPLLADCMVSYVRMLVVIIGGCVLSGTVTRYVKMEQLEGMLKINKASITGLLLSCVNSIAITRLWQDMDRQGKRMNAAFAVSGAYLIGGQFAVISEAGDSRLICAFFISKLTAGVLAVIILRRRISKETLPQN